jgi:hypothetical protein
MDKNEYIGYLRYHGELVKDGYLDARKAANALIGFDEVLRYFIHQESPRFQEVEFEIPVKIEKGSWLAFIPDTIQEWLLTGGGIAATTYLTTAAKKLAENDFKDVGIKDLFKKAFQGFYWVVKLGTHIGTLKKSKFENVKFRNDNKEVGILNENGETLFIPIEYLDFYTNCPDSLFSKISEIIEPERELEIGLSDKEETASIKYSDKEIFFVKKEDDDEIVLPELKHGDYVELTGHITRGNENSNTLGFLYNNHILTSKLREGSIIRFKSNLFSNVLIKGYIDRLDKNGFFKEKKPRVEIIELTEIIEKEDRNFFSRE